MQRFRRLPSVLLALLGVSPCFAQLPNATNITATPAPGGHDYLRSPVETVNPANGSVSIRIPLRIAPGRQLTLPFSIAYDSNGAFYMKAQGSGPSYTSGPLSLGTQGGWSYSYPLISFEGTTWTIPGSNDNLITCHGSYNYVYQDATGGRHNLALSVSPNVASPDGYDNCNEGATGDGEFATGGEGSILATTSIPGGNTGSFPAVYVTDADGTGYYIPGGAPGIYLARSVTDRNGNTISIVPQSGGSDATDQVTYSDTIGRIALTVSGLGGNPDTISPSGSGSYQVYWTSASAQFTDNMVNLEPGVDPNCPTSMAASSTVISQIDLPDGQTFKMLYDPTYGMLTKLTYPGGGYVRYVWGLNSQAEAGLFPWNVSADESWACRYDFPAITDRYVSYDGTTEALHQHFSYATQWSGNSLDWTQKTTTITTTDNVRNASYSTNYVYSSLPTAYVPNCVGCFLTEQVPVENTITYNDYSGSVLQTVTESWENIRLLQTVQTSVGGQSSLKVYCYNNWEQTTETDEYDLGAGSPSGPCASPPSGTTSGALLRKTTTGYATFSGHIVDLPSLVITYDGSGNRVAETDYPLYDSVGNLKTKTVDCFAVTGGQACSQGNSTTTYMYDTNGQVTSTADPNGNTPTQLSYVDSYSSCGGSGPPQSPSDAYLTKVTYPSVNGVSHIVSYCYDYVSGLLLSATDENLNTTNYSYNDPFVRLKTISNPDGGSTGYSYSDGGPTPMITTTTQMSSSQQMITETVMNGLYAPYKTELTTDPYGTDNQVTTLDGLGKPYQVYNPYRTTSDPTYGITTYVYDALGRTTSVTYPDSSSSTTVYAGNCSTITNPNNTARKSCWDGLGRVTSVFEDPLNLDYETDYAYDGNSDLTRVDQWGGPKGSSGDRVRIFGYDSQGGLVNACNPETVLAGSTCGTSGVWSNTYTYDPNKNLLSKTDARGVTVQYGYDALNRMTSKTYTNDPSQSPWSCYQYDISSLAGTGANLIGRLTNEWTQPGGTACASAPPSSGVLTVRSALAYDAMGRETSVQQCGSGSCASLSGPTVTFGYDLAGDVTGITNPYGAQGNSLGLTYGYDGAAHQNSVVSNWTAFPTSLFTIGTNGYTAAGQLQNWMQGPNLTVTQGYTKRLWMNSIVATGQIP
jgi:YD repeat-containing protein